MPSFLSRGLGTAEDPLASAPEPGGSYVLLALQRFLGDPHAARQWLMDWARSAWASGLSWDPSGIEVFGRCGRPSLVVLFRRRDAGSSAVRLEAAPEAKAGGPSLVPVLDPEQGQGWIRYTAVAAGTYDQVLARCLQAEAGPGNPAFQSFQARLEARWRLFEEEVRWRDASERLEQKRRLCFFLSSIHDRRLAAEPPEIQNLFLDSLFSLLFLPQDDAPYRQYDLRYRGAWPANVNYQRILVFEPLFGDFRWIVPERPLGRNRIDAVIGLASLPGRIERFLDLARRPVVRSAWEEGRISWDEVHDPRARDIMMLIRRAGIRSLVFGGGAVRDILLGRPVADFDIGIRSELTGAEREEFSEKPVVANERLADLSLRTAERLARALGITSARLMNLQQGEKATYQGVPIDYAGPVEVITPGGRRFYQRRLLYDSVSRRIYPTNTTSDILQMGLDEDGRFYGPPQALADLLWGRIQFVGPEGGTFFGDIFRAYRLHYQYGFVIDEETQRQISRAVERYRTGVIPLILEEYPQVREQLEKLIAGAPDPAQARRDMDALGLPQLLEAVAERGLPLRLAAWEDALPLAEPFPAPFPDVTDP